MSKGAASIAIVLAACGGTSHHGGVPTEDAKTLRDDAAARVVAASATHDATAIAALFSDEVTYGGLWFPDAECRARFAATGKISGPDLGALAQCLAPLALVRGVHVHPYPNVAVFTYEPGIEIEVMFELSSSKIRWIGYAGRRASDPLPTVTDRALLALRIDPVPFALDAAAQKRLEDEYAARHSEGKHPPAQFSAWFKLCLDAEGGLTGVHPYSASSLLARDTFAAVVGTWRFKPFVLGGQPSPVCALVRIDVPALSSGGEGFPYPAPAIHPDAIFVSPEDLGKRVVGSIMVPPDPQDMTAIGMSEVSTVSASMNYCIGTDGKVDWVQLLTQTEFPGYNRKLQKAVASWQYEPPPEPLCATVVFVYSQR